MTMDGGSGVESVFGAALGLVSPWQVSRVEFDPDGGRLGIHLDYGRGSQFACPMSDCDQLSRPAHDRLSEQWRHLDFFQHEAYLSARSSEEPIRATSSTGVTRITGPFARRPDPRRQID